MRSPYHLPVTLNLSQVFVRYPSVDDAASTLIKFFSSRATAEQDVPQHILLKTPTPWIAVHAWGNNAAPEAAEYLSRVLEAQAVWFGLAGRVLAYRLRHYQHGRKTDEAQSPPEIFGAPEPFALPAYVDAERDLLAKLGDLPANYVYLRADEIGMDPDGEPDAIALLAAPWKEKGFDSKRFRHRPPRATSGIRTLFDRQDSEKQVVADEVVLRGTWDEERGRGLLALLESMAKRRAIPAGWKYVYVLSSAAGPALLKPLGELFAREKQTRQWSYELAIE